MWKPIVAAFILALTATPVLAQAPNGASEEARADAVLAAIPGFSGSVLVVRDGRTVFRKAYGQANRELWVPNTPSTKFRIGSMTKQFTAFAILQLAEAGRLSLADPVSKHYSTAPASWDGITLKHLLTHTSGIPSYTGLPDFSPRHSRDPHTPEQIIELTRDMPLTFQPGSRYAYNNTGYVILGLVIEKVSGQPYAQYVQSNIFEALGMKDSGYDNWDRIIPNRAAGYGRRSEGVVNARYLDMSLPYAAGSLYSTVDDMLIWDQALAAGKLIPPASYQAMWTDHGFGYGYGWQVEQRFGRRRVAHGGGSYGFSAFFSRYPQDRVSVVVLSNFADNSPEAIADRLAAIYLRLPEQRPAVPGGEAALRKLIEGIRRGEPDHAGMSPGFANVTRPQLATLQRNFASLGEIRSITLIAAELDGRDRYRVEGASGVAELSIIVTPDGVVQSAGMRLLPPGQ